MCKYKKWDEVLAYPTVKIVKVKDRYLGAIRYVMMLAIFAYLIGYVLMYNSGYNLCVVPTGSIELSLKKPDGWMYPSNYSYCSQNLNANLSYPLPCQVVDESDVYQPVDQTNAMFIVTRFNQIYQQRNPNCSNGAPCAVPWIGLDINDTNKTYSTGIESFTIRFSHFFQARQFYLDTRDDYYSQSCAEMTGKLVNYKGHKIASYGNNGSDIIPLGTILLAAGVDLDDISEYPPNANDSETNRYAGVVLFFGIDYEGTYKSAIKYTYTVTQVPKVEYKVTRSTIVNFGQRLISDTHGVKIFFVFSGSICRFDFQTLLIQLVAGLGLLFIATLTTDFLMEYMMPLKAAYVKYKYKETEHHDALRKKLTQKNLHPLEISQDTNVSVNEHLSNDKPSHYQPLDGDEPNRN